MTLNAAKDVEVRNNFVKTESKDDYPYVLVSGSILNDGSGNNKVQNLDFSNLKLHFIVIDFLKMYN